MMKFHFKSFRKYFSLKRVMFFWYQYYKALFLLGFAVVLGFGGYFWYSNLYQYRWTEEQRSQFVEKNFKATVFQENKFHQLVADLRDRAKRHRDPVPLSRDIFSGERLR
jgi:hypothetical protein